MQIKSAGDDRGASRKCGCSEYELQSSSKTLLAFELAEGSERKEDEESVRYHLRFI
jgi:hypothetical protein